MYQINGYSGYEMDENGNIYSKERYVAHAKTGLQKVLYKKRKPIKHSTGYLVITLKEDNGTSTKTIRYHVLVANTLVPNPENKPYVNHKDGDKTNYHPSNLEWVTAKENHTHAVVNGLASDCIGVNNHACRFTIDEVGSWLISLKNGKMIKEVSLENNCDRNTISRLIKIYFPEEFPKYDGSSKSRFKQQGDKQ